MQALWGAPIGLGVNIAVQMYMSSGSMGERFDNVDWGKAGVATVAGAVSGGVSAVAGTAATTTGMVAANVVGNAAVSAVSTQVSAQIRGETASASEVLQGAAISGIAAGAGAAVEALPGAISRAAPAGMSQTEKTATYNLLSGMQKATPDFNYTSPVQTSANAAGAAISASPDLEPILKKDELQ